MIAVEEIDDVILLIIDNAYFNPAPSSAFESDAEKKEFIAYIRAVIAEREKKQDYSASNPQISEGTSIRAKLAELERQLLTPKDISTTLLKRKNRRVRNLNNAA